MRRATLLKGGGLLIILFWLIMMGVHLKREGLPPFGSPAASSPAPRLTHPVDTWMGIFLSGNGKSGQEERIGFLNSTSTPEMRGADVGVSLTLTARMRLTLLNVPTDIYVSGSAWAPQETGLSELEFQIRAGEHTMRLGAKVHDNMLDARIYTAGEEIPFQFPIGGDLLLTGAMGTTTLNVPYLSPGQEITVDTFDPMTLAMGKARVKCEGEETIQAAGREVKAKVIIAETAGMTTRAWVTDEEEIVRVETPFGFTLMAMDPRDAMAPIDGSASNALYQMVALTPKGAKPFRGAQRMTVDLTGVDPSHLPPADETQEKEGGVYTITVPQPPDDAATIGEGLDAEYLGGDAFVQTTHPDIVETAKSIVQDEPSPWVRARRIYDWVYENIEKVPVVSVPSAIEVLDTREGDCNEHTVLYTALARAAGIPTRIAIGVVWSDELKGFYYHAWPEVYLGRWYWLDPTLGQLMADATHIKLLNGGIQQWPQLLPFLGKLDIEVVSIE